MEIPATQSFALLSIMQTTCDIDRHSVVIYKQLEIAVEREFSKRFEIAEKMMKLWLFWEELDILFTLLQYITSKNLSGSLFREELPILLSSYVFTILYYL